MELVLANDQFKENLVVLRKAFPGTVNSMHGVGALMCAAAGKSIDLEYIKECKKIFKENTGIFSALREHLMLPIVVKMALAEDPEKYLKGIQEVHDKISEGYLINNEGRVMAAITIYENCAPSEVDNAIAKTKQIFELMKNEHPFLTCQYDMNFASLMALEKDSAQKRIADMEDCYDIITKRFSFSRDAVQSVCQVLSLSDVDAETKSARFNEIYDALKKEGKAIVAGPQLAIIGVLANLDAPIDEIAEKVKEYTDYIAHLPGMGIMGVDAQERRMMAASLTAIEYLNSDENATNVAVNAVVSMIINFEIMLMVIIIMNMTASHNN